jgi:hypothetical protein
MVMVMVGMPAGFVSATRVVAVGAIVVLVRTGPGPSGNAEGSVVGSATVLVGAARARLLAMLDIPMLKMNETL